METQTADQTLREALGYKDFPNDVWNTFKARHQDWYDKVIASHIKYASIHVEAALDRASFDVDYSMYDGAGDEPEIEIKRESITSCYPKELLI